MNVLQWPAKSPDLSPIEHLWDHLGRQVRERHDVNKIRDLERALQVIRKLICSMRRRYLAVLAANGGHTRYEPCPNFYAWTPPPLFISRTPETKRRKNNYGITLMQVIGDKNQIPEDVFNFMISYLPFPQKSVRSEIAKLLPSVYFYSTSVSGVAPLRDCFRVVVVKSSSI